MRRHPLLAYFGLAYAISWAAWLPYILSADGIGVFAYRVPYLLGDGQLTGVLPGAYLGPLTAAFVVTAVTEGRPGLRAWRRRLLTWRVGWRWYLFALIGFPAVCLLGTLVLPEARMVLPPPGVWAAYAVMLVLQFLTTGLAEEPGWRDFALPRIQERHGPLGGTLILGLLWAGWHLPLFLTAWAGPVTPMSLVLFTVLAVVLSIIFTWVFNRARQSLPLIMLLHGTFNNLSSVLAPEMFPGMDHQWNWGPVLGTSVLAVLIVIATRGRLGAPAQPAQVAPA
ncbi:CPBP family intramembrane glutamic endopeptidase [Nonomuraea typhae]|uniref:CPBP family intramembrane glutamic endopeptidase n=1 Tax=Nonomuraea typhae TaxID=2603600 RepID=A0ABW7YNC8_9ACTN